jgi:hypothetical protein
MIALLLYLFVGWLIWRWLSRTTYVEIAPPPSAMPVTIVTPSIVIHIQANAPRSRIAAVAER